ncbi:MAG TPA: glycosyltransferase family 2 protein [Blastocatellia bacterium]|nr:glycosyltransferase family 2 protein [Blastocatellia bacterium]
MASEQTSLTPGPPSLTLVVLTRNEELNLSACLESLRGCAREIMVVDSGSTDATIDIAMRCGATIFRHDFDTHAKQWDWALSNLPIQTDWILALDADQRLTPELRDEIAGLITGSGEATAAITGAYTSRRQIFRGTWIRHGGYYPKYLLKLFRTGSARVDVGDMVDHHFRVQGNVVKLKHDLIEDNQNEADISVWTAKHNRYAKLQALQEYGDEIGRGGQFLAARLFGTPDERTLWLKRLWSKLPLYLRPLLYFIYRYFMRLGFLDGKQGLVFHFLQGFWYRLLVDVNLDELRRAGSSTDAPNPVQILARAANGGESNTKEPVAAAKEIRG